MTQTMSSSIVLISNCLIKRCRYQYEELKDDDADDGEGDVKKIPLHGSDSWWVLVHNALKKLILRDVM